MHPDGSNARSASSEHYKTAIVPMGSRTGNMEQLRPVGFHLKSDPKGPLQYGLIAEEVARVYPELETRDEADVIQGIRYDELAPMLINEMQRQHTADQKRETALERRLSLQAHQLQDLSRQLVAMRDIVNQAR
jgi:hypothetical protein